MARVELQITFVLRVLYQMMLIPRLYINGLATGKMAEVQLHAIKLFLLMELAVLLKKPARLVIY